MLRDLGLGDFGRRHADIAVDLGSTNTRIGARGRGLLLELPSVVAMERKGGMVFFPSLFPLSLSLLRFLF